MVLVCGLLSYVARDTIYVLEIILFFIKNLLIIRFGAPVDEDFLPPWSTVL